MSHNFDIKIPSSDLVHVKHGRNWFFFGANILISAKFHESLPIFIFKTYVSKYLRILVKIRIFRLTNMQISAIIHNIKLQTFTRIHPCLGTWLLRNHNLSLGLTNLQSLKN